MTCCIFSVAVCTSRNHSHSSNGFVGVTIVTVNFSSKHTDLFLTTAGPAYLSTVLHTHKHDDTQQLVANSTIARRTAGLMFGILDHCLCHIFLESKFLHYLLHSSDYNVHNGGLVCYFPTIQKRHIQQT